MGIVNAFYAFKNQNAKGMPKEREMEYYKNAFGYAFSIRLLLSDTIKNLSNSGHANQFQI